MRIYSDLFWRNVNADLFEMYGVSNVYCPYLFRCNHFFLNLLSINGKYHSDFVANIAIVQLNPYKQIVREWRHNIQSRKWMYNTGKHLMLTPILQEFTAGSAYSWMCVWLSMPYYGIRGFSHTMDGVRAIDISTQSTQSSTLEIWCAKFYFAVA